MAWPPPVQKTDWINADVSLDNHPSAHNDIALTLEQDYTPQISANVTAISTNTGAIAAHEAVYALDGTMTGTAPGFNSDGNIAMRTGAGVYYASVSGFGGTAADIDTTVTFPTTGGYSTGNAQVTLDVSATNKQVYCVVTATAVGVLQGTNTEGLFVKAGWNIDSTGYIVTDDNYRGYARNRVDPGTIEVTIQTLPFGLDVPGTANSVTFIPSMLAVGTTVECISTQIHVMSFWR